ncbi:S41 family peptidase [Aureivirga sp. CE67]|uniref:S41 family peptidase n=1 Tax=Aureivirga sp. CE67 TaxID=1788983 RepID=UPI0018CA3C4B|nr:S41 family peptidase [Aureivirga sp. CE67]
MKKNLLLLVVLLPLFSFAQNCDCTSKFEWVKKTFEENDAGFSYILEKKGKEAYENHNRIFREKVADLEDEYKCGQALYEWLYFFRKFHLGIQLLNYKEAEVVKESDREIIAKFKDWEKRDLDLKEFKKYLSSKKTQDYEGIWSSPPYTIAIKKVGDSYEGIILEADGVYWQKGQVKLKIEKGKEENRVTYYLKDHSARNYKINTFGKSRLTIGFVILERKFPEIEAEPEVERFLHTMTTKEPYFEKIDNKTVLLRIPSFAIDQKAKIDSLIQANKKLIHKTPNFIIDIRNNGGGGDSSFQELLPIIYTNPIRTVKLELLSTPLNNSRLLDYIENDYGFSEKQKESFQRDYDTLSKHLGEFVRFGDEPIVVDTFDKVYKYPENVGIIINENVASTSEQFLLAAKQSKKVKLFGTSTLGVLDISNQYNVKSPCEDILLTYSISKSLRIPHMTIDGKGIQPDYYIHKSTPRYEWINYVTEILNEK